MSLPTAPPTAPPTLPSTWQHATKVNYFRYLHSPEGKAEFRLGFPWVSAVIAGLLFLTIIAIPAAIGHAIGMTIRQSMRRKKFDQAVALAKRCEPIFVYPIMVNTRLRQFQNQRAPGLVMGSFEDLGDEYFANLATVLESISHAAPNALNPADAALRQALTDENYTESRRRRIPDEFTGGMPVFLFDLMIDGRKLFGGRLMTPRILCMADRGERGVIFNIPYHALDVPTYSSQYPSNAKKLPEDPHISDDCFALVPAATGPGGLDHPIHAVVDDITQSCPRCRLPLVSLLTLRLDAPELRSIASKVKLSTAGLPILRVIVCEHCCVECLHTFAAFGPAGELIPDSVRVIDEMSNETFPPSPPVSPRAADMQRRWKRNPLRLDPTPRPPDAAINYALGSANSQIGGLPRWTQDPEPPSCPSCRGTMPFLAHFDVGDLGDGDTDLFAFWCPQCATSAVIPQQS